MTRENNVTGLFARAAAAIALALALAGAASAQGLDWFDISGPTGYTRFFELGDGTLFATDENLFVRSLDGGATWFEFPRPGGAILEFAARGNAAVMAIRRAQAANYKQYFLSTDRGDSWTRIATEGASGTVHVLMTLSADGTPHALYQVGAKMAVERLVEGAWEQMGVPAGVYGTVAGTGTPGYVTFEVDGAGAFYIGSRSDGIHSSRDGGQTWTKALPYRYVNSITESAGGRVAIATTPNGRTAGGVFVSDDRGVSWGLPGMTDLFAAGLDFSPAGDLLFLANPSFSGGPTTIYRLATGSAAWDSLPSFLEEYLALHVTGAGRIITAAPYLGLNISDDGGETWKTDGVRQQDLFTIAKAPDGTLLAGTVGRGIFRTTDGGGRWERVTAAGTPEYFYSLTHLDTVLLGGTERGLFASEDGGSSWTPLTADLTPGGVELVVEAVLVRGGGGILIGTGAGIYRSDDRGATWSPSGLGSTAVRSIASSPDGRVYALTGEDGIFASTDGGRTWASRGLVEPGLLTVGVADNGQICVGGPSGIWFSTDGGAVWTRRIFTEGHVHSILFNGSFNVFAGSSGGLFVSSDAGRSWESAGLDGLFVISLAYDRDHAMVAAVYKGGVARSVQVVTSVTDPPAVPAGSSLSQNYPNPFNPVTEISFSVPSPSRVKLTVFDVLGREVETLIDGDVPAGRREAAWDGSLHPSGVYFYRIEILPESPPEPGRLGPPFTQTRKMLLLK